MKQARDTMPMIQFGVRLRALRRQCRLTQQTVADRLRIHRTTYTKYETGSVTPDQQGLIKLAEIFGVSVDYLLGREEDITPLYVEENNNQPMILTAQEKLLVQMFRQLSREEQQGLTIQAQKVFRERKKG